MTWNTCKVKNISGTTKTFYNKTLTNNEEYIIPIIDRLNWITDNTYIEIASDNLQIGNGESYFTSYVDQWNYLQNI